MEWNGIYYLKLVIDLHVIWHVVLMNGHFMTEKKKTNNKLKKHVFNLLQNWLAHNYC